MAKQSKKESKEKNSNKFEFSKVTTLMNNISKTVPIYIDREVRDIKFISTGIYLVDAAISGRLLGGGVRSDKIFTMGGESGSGKSFLAYSIAKNAQRDHGYSIIFIDTEGSIDLKSLPDYGVDISEDKFMLIRSNKVEEINMALTTLLEELKKEKIAGNELQPIMIILDSIGAMSSTKEMSDLLKMDIKADFTKAKALGSLFRSISSDLSYLGIPMINCNHTYDTMDMFSQPKLKGGNAALYASSTVAFMTKAKLKDPSKEDDMDLQSGIIVTFKTVKSRLARPKKIKFEILFTSGLNPYSGLDAFCRPEYFDKIGIAQGKEEVDRSTGELTFKPGGNRWYVSHLGKTVTTKQLYSSEVFTKDVLEKMEPIVNEYFKYKSIEEIEEMEQKFKNLIESDDDIDDDGFSNMDAEDLFD